MFISPLSSFSSLRLPFPPVDLLSPGLSRLYCSPSFFFSGTSLVAMLAFVLVALTSNRRIDLVLASH